MDDELFYGPRLAVMFLVGFCACARRVAEVMEETLCPECGGQMVSQKNGATGQRFWGCTNYPTCRVMSDDGE